MHLSSDTGRDWIYSEVTVFGFSAVMTNCVVREAKKKRL